MYDINLVGKVVMSSARNSKVVKGFKAFSFFLTIGMICALLYSGWTFLKIQDMEIQINTLKGKIEDSKRINKVKEVEEQWTRYYYQILAIKNIIGKNTTAGLMLRDIGLYIPEGDKICGIELTKDNKIKEFAKIEKFSASYDIPSYADVLKESYSRSSFIGSPITIEEIPVPVSVNGKKVETLAVTIPYVAEKK